MRRITWVESVTVKNLFHFKEDYILIEVSANGTVPSPLWTRPMFYPFVPSARTDDDFIDINFEAELHIGVALTACRIGLLQTLIAPGWTRGVRVHSLTNTIEAKMDTLPQARPSDDVLLPEGFSLPWWTPDAQKK